MSEIKNKHSYHAMSVSLK